VADPLTPSCSACQQFARIVASALAGGKAIEIDGLGVFIPDPRHGFRFEARNGAQIFIAYAKEDEVLARRLYDDLAQAGFTPWMDVCRLLPGQNWPRAIEAAIEESDFFVACFSQRSARKKGGFQAEVRHALECARRVPLDEIFLVPVRLDQCTVPPRIQGKFHYIDLYPSWHEGIERLLAMIRKETAVRHPAA
jgi:hypothetical protein